LCEQADEYEQQLGHKERRIADLEAENLLELKVNLLSSHTVSSRTLICRFA